MVIKSFPPLETADEDGLLAMGGDLEVPSLLLSYSQGIFPWPTEGYPLLWFSPWKRAILEFDRWHLPDRVHRYFQKAKWAFRINTSFKEVIHQCALRTQDKKNQGTWILPEMEEAYTRLYEAGYALSFEVFNKNEKLVGGLYGVSIGKYFAAESMYYEESQASKFAMDQGIRYLQDKGLTWMDIQVMTPHMKSFGAVEVSRELFLEMLKKSI